jgi:hypothetical protein
MIMRKIICLYMEEKKINKAILEECSRHSRLVEPQDGKVLLDLSIFRQAGEIVRQLADFLQKENAGPARLGLGTNPLVACCAACRRDLPLAAAGQKSYRQLLLGSITMVQVIPGREQDFVASLALTEFPPLSARERKRLMRLGYSRVGEIARLSSLRLGQILRCDALPLWQKCQGIDHSPVRGLYPPERLACALPLLCGEDRHGLEMALKQISLELEAQMAKRHMACRHLCLEVLGEKDSIRQERSLGHACYEASHLTRLLSELLPETGLPFPVEELRVYLDRLEGLEVGMPDLFTWSQQHYQEEERRRQLQAAIRHLRQRFPQGIQMGAKVGRREQVLALWDPWRFGPENPDKVR